MHGSGLFRRFVGGLLVAATALVFAAPHRHALSDFSDAEGMIAGGERVVSSHDPLSRASHWHASRIVKDDDCIACRAHRFSAPFRMDSVPAPVLGSPFACAPQTDNLASRLQTPSASRAPPSLL